MAHSLEKKLKAVPVWDPPETAINDKQPLHFYVLEGKCRKCGLGDNTLVFYEFKLNTKDADQSIFKTQCLSCGHRDIHYSSSVQKSV